MAFGVYEAIRRRGLRVPDDVSVVGFDDLPEVRWSSPPLTTVRQPLSEMGDLAARTVLRLAQGETMESPRLELATTLIVRSSTARPARRPHPPPRRPLTLILRFTIGRSGLLMIMGSWQVAPPPRYYGYCARRDHRGPAPIWPKPAGSRTG